MNLQLQKLATSEGATFA